MHPTSRLKKAEVETIIKNGLFIGSHSFSIRALYNKEVSLKVAFVASKKIFKTAVLRNKAKRRGREALRAILTKIKNGQYVFFLKKTALEITVKDLQDEVLKLLTK